MSVSINSTGAVSPAPSRISPPAISESNDFARLLNAPALPASQASKPQAAAQPMPSPQAEMPPAPPGEQPAQKSVAPQGPAKNPKDPPSEAAPATAQAPEQTSSTLRSRSKPEGVRHALEHVPTDRSDRDSLHAKTSSDESEAQAGVQASSLELAPGLPDLPVQTLAEHVQVPAPATAQTSLVVLPVPIDGARSLPSNPPEASSVEGDELAVPLDLRPAVQGAALADPKVPGTAEARSQAPAFEMLQQGAAIVGLTAESWKIAQPGEQPPSRELTARAVDAAAATALLAASPGLSARMADAVPAPSVTVPVPVQVSLSTPVESPEFPKALGMQLSVLTRSGVQQAEIHLNPRELGPISVQIELQGTHAQVNFGADLIATRQVIENGLPELAAALNSAGFTLSGGGVHHQARGQRDGQAQHQSSRPAGQEAEVGVADESAPSTAAQRRVAMGGVDLYA